MTARNESRQMLKSGRHVLFPRAGEQVSSELAACHWLTTPGRLNAIVRTGARSATPFRILDSSRSGRSLIKEGEGHQWKRENPAYMALAIMMALVADPFAIVPALLKQGQRHGSKLSVSCTISSTGSHAASVCSLAKGNGGARPRTPLGDILSADVARHP